VAISGADGAASQEALMARPSRFDVGHSAQEDRFGRTEHRLRQRVGRGSDNGAASRTGAACALRSMISSRPSWCSTSAVRLSTQSPSLHYSTPSLSRISAWWMRELIGRVAGVGQPLGALDHANRSQRVIPSRWPSANTYMQPSPTSTPPKLCETYRLTRRVGAVLRIHVLGSGHHEKAS
jgi:hypothetical protein